MKNFKYSAITIGLKKVNGILSANDLKEAKIALKEKNLKPIEIKETKIKLQGKQLFSKKKLRADVVSHFCRQFRIIIVSGINRIVGLESMASKSKDKIMAQEINKIINSLKTCGSISEVMLNEGSKFLKLLGAIVSMRFSRALYLFTSTGYPLLQGLDYIKDSINNAISEKAIDIAKEGVIKGEYLAENLEKIDYFDPIFLQMISIGE